MQRLAPFLTKKSIRYIVYFSLTAVMIFLLWGIGQFFSLNNFLESVEVKTMDFRFGIPNRTIKPNPNVVILSIDDNTLEILQDEYGTFPWRNRGPYIEAVNYLEKNGVDSIVFDLMFVNYQKGFEAVDKELAKTIGAFNNVYVAMNFDNMERANVPVLPDKLKVKVENRSFNINFFDSTYESCRLIMKDIINLTSNIGITNFSRDDDGISRHAFLFIKYKNDFYPYLGFKAAYEYLKKHEKLNDDKFVINENNELILGKKKVQLDKKGSMLINWYGPENTFQYIPFWQIITSAKNIKEGKKPIISPEELKNKIVFIGVTANQQFDIKSTPLSKIYPGVEIQATSFNNIIDNVSVKRLSPNFNFIICTILGLITGLLVIKLRSVFLSSLSVIIMAALYIFLASILFLRYFLWLDMVNPILVISLSFIFMYVIKYVMKSRDFEYTYRLATTDGLTGLYNHRYFQETLENAIIKAKKNNQHFSLIFVDIDYFKKFNDTYGHQAGDIVLKQVAQILKRTVKSTDFVARYGGEEMSAILYYVDTNDAVRIANRLCRKVASARFRLSEAAEVSVNISLGVSTYPQHGNSPSELIEFADQGLYRAKRDGRNQVGKIMDAEQENPSDEPEAGKV